MALSIAYVCARRRPRPNRSRVSPALPDVFSIAATEGHRRLLKDDVREVESCLRYVMRNGLSVLAKCRMLLIVLLK